MTFPGSLLSGSVPFTEFEVARCSAFFKVENGFSTIDEFDVIIRWLDENEAATGSDFFSFLEHPTTGNWQQRQGAKVAAPAGTRLAKLEVRPDPKSFVATEFFIDKVALIRDFAEAVGIGTSTPAPRS